MKFEITFLRSKVARRIFILFISCALVPIVFLAILSFSHVTKQLNEQSQRRLHQASKTMGQNILERLLILEIEMKMITSNLKADSYGSLPTPSEGFNTHIKQEIKGLKLITDAGKHIDFFGSIQNTPELTPGQKQHILSGKTVVSIESRSDSWARIFMSKKLNPEYPGYEILWAEIDPLFLWYMQYEKTLPFMTELCILDQSNNVLFSSLPLPLSLPEEAVLKMSHASLGQFGWSHGEEEYLASFWTVALQGSYSSPNWIVVLSEPKAYVLEPMAYFKKIFILVILASLWVVLLLSINQIRRSLVPLERLKEGTQRIARRDFNSRVTVTSGDEFEEVAASFNTMATQLGKQFKTLTTMAEIDRLILSSLDYVKIVDTILTYMREIFPCEGVSVTIVDSNDLNKAQIYVGESKYKNGKHRETIKLKPEELQKLSDNPHTLLIELDEALPSYLAPLASRGIKSFLVLPIFLKQKLSGIITLGYLEPPGLTQEDLAQARQLTDQAAVAFSNARLIDELNQLSWGTLTALARTIDAKSPWTAGHSERVTELALQIGQVIGLSSEDLDSLRRGGLLHDIGKIGIPPEILDKPGKLTAEERKLMQKHVRLGARILEPIDAFAEAIPIVLQHHERFDGKGYPEGLAGEAINFNARIFAVADYFEAITSKRPYRKALERQSAIKFIKQRAGSEFDPKVVQAFLEAIIQEERE
ncbi:MAG: HD domain-containing protein [Candidatus Aminicenantes bacterium]|nr:HD domain-containing protein [Candidatus Aminicenantes bacterium]